MLVYFRLMKHYNIHITGKVQGVFFRARTKDKAKELGITGFVRNERDGSVYIEAEGSKRIIDEFISWCHKGPDLSIITKVEVNEVPLKNFTGFEIKRDEWF